MASSTTTSVVDTTAVKTVPNAPPRKRRRRTGATGAAEDCFTCRKRGVRCDRRRPYCSQCLEFGKECSGYRTTLTWGVGVASRGKLRGLSLPIVNSTQKAADANEDPKDEPSSTSKGGDSPSKSPGQELSTKVEDSYGSGYLQSAELSPALFSPGYHPTSPIPIPASQGHHHHHQGWHMAGFNDHFEYASMMGKAERMQISPNPLRRLHTAPIATSYEDSIFSAPSTGSVSTFSDSDFPSPNELPPTPGELVVTEPYVHSYQDSFACQPETMSSLDGFSYLGAARSYPSSTSFVTPTLSSIASSQACFNMMPPASAPTTFSDLLHCNDFTPVVEAVPQFSMPQKVEQEYLSDSFSDFSVSTPSTWATSCLQPTPEPGFSHLPPRMRFLLEYYDETICSSTLVAFDSDRNPYRVHVVPLAVNSAALQNAVAAFSVSVIRKKGLQQQGEVGAAQFDEYSSNNLHAEEINYKTCAVALFDAALKNPMQATDDSVLATLLILSLYHLSEGGFAGFRTQLDGVKRLLSLRSTCTAFSAWAEDWFTWFDIMTATVNDRDASDYRSETLDSFDLSANLGALELLAGCDGRMYKLLARLGRLNIHTPTKPKQDYFLGSSRPCATSPAPTQKYLPTNQYTNGIARTATPIPISSGDACQEIWNQFLHVRSRLSSWVSHPSFSTISYLASDGDDNTLHHISRLFRLAAAMYALRASSPHLAERSAPVQSIVAKAMSHFAAIPASSAVNNFLLWPILIIGTECVNLIDRDLIRQRVLEVASGHFFHHFSCLDVFEQVWAQDFTNDAWAYFQPTITPRLNALGVASATRWQNAMRRLENQFIVM